MTRRQPVRKDKVPNLPHVGKMRTECWMRRLVGDVFTSLTATHIHVPVIRRVFSTGGACFVVSLVHNSTKMEGAR